MHRPYVNTFPAFKHPVLHHSFREPDACIIVFESPEVVVFTKGPSLDASPDPEVDMGAFLTYRLLELEGRQH